MTTSKLIISILIMAAITFGTRLAPFVIFGRGEKPPEIIIYLGQIFASSNYNNYNCILL